MTIYYDEKSTIIYALGRAIETEDDPSVRLQLEDLEERVTDGSVTVQRYKSND